MGKDPFSISAHRPLAPNNTLGGTQLAENRGRGKNQALRHSQPEPPKKGSSIFHAAHIQEDGSTACWQFPFFCSFGRLQSLEVPLPATSGDTHTSRQAVMSHPRQPIEIPIEHPALDEVNQTTKATAPHFQFPRQQQDQPAAWTAQ
jgi:hypothetical protein